MINVTAKIKEAVSFVRESRDEMQRVTWPDRDEVTSFTVVVLITVIVVSAFLWMVDTGLMLLTQTVLK